MKHKIHIVFEHFGLERFRIAAIIRKCICATLNAEQISVPCEINVLITNDEGIRIINRTSRDLDKPTDVLSFPMFQFEPGNPPSDWMDYQDPATGLCPLGDMCISLERAVAQAQEFGHSTRREIGYLTIHSMLHLLGYDHIEKEDETLMIKRQKEILDAMGLKKDE